MRIIVYGKEPLPDFVNPVLTIGAFDGLHSAHKKIISKLIKSAQDLSGESILLSFDPHPRTILDPSDASVRLLTSLEERIQILEETELDYFIIVPFDYSFSLMMPEEYLENFILSNFKPKKILAGYDHRFGKDAQGDIILLKQYAAKGHYEFEEIEAQTLAQSSISSSKIRTFIKNKHILQANELLGYPYMFRGKVVPGNRKGRELGFPTANILINNSFKLIPPNGVYSARCLVNGKLLDGMIYIHILDNHPNHLDKTIEINIFDFVQEIYGQTISVYLLEYIRDPKLFPNDDYLIEQINLDKLNSIQKYKIHFSPIRKVKTAVVILNYNGKHLFEKYLASVLKHLPLGVEIYIIDNNSTDNSCIYLEHHYPEVKLLKLKHNYGFAEGYNKGLFQIDADYFVLLNSDVQIENDWISGIIDRMKADPNILVAQPKILDLGNKAKFEYAGAAGGYIDILGYPFCRGRIIDYIENDTNQYNSTAEVFWASGAAFIIKSSAFKSLNGFDGDYFAHQEEIDLCWRLKRLGGKVVCFPDSVVYHLGGGTLDYSNPRKTYLNFRNNLFTIFKNSNWLSLLYILPIRLALDILIALSYILKGKFKIAYKILQAYIISIINTVYLIHKKKYNDQIIKKLQYKPADKKGLLNTSIFLQYYFSGNKCFSELPDQYFSKK
jgi:riboflavin kinase/FMN adenylyltransferase